MPSAQRSRTAFSVGDVQISDRATQRGLALTPSRVQRWRLGGLLPDPDVEGTRPPTAPAGRRPRHYSPALLAALDEIVMVLCRHARRGRPTTDLAMILFAARLPVKISEAQRGIELRLARLREETTTTVAEAMRIFPPPQDSGWDTSATFEESEAMARLAVAQPTSVRSIRANLRTAGLPSDRDEILSVVTQLIATLRGEPIVTDDESTHAVMHALALHGLVEPASPDVPALLEEGPAAFLRAASQIGPRILGPMPDDVSADELAEGRDLLIDLARAAAAVATPVAEVLHYLGGARLLSLLDLRDLDQLAVYLAGAVQVRRLRGVLDASPILEAVTEIGGVIATRDAYARSLAT